jgi:hypothetical protein
VQLLGLDGTGLFIPQSAGRNICMYVRAIVYRALQFVSYLEINFLSHCCGTITVASCESFRLRATADGPVVPRDR